MPVPGSTLFTPTPTFKATQTAKPGVWSPGQPSTSSITETKMTKSEETSRSSTNDKIVPVWQPHGQPGSNEKQFRSVKMDSVGCIRETKTQTTINKVTTPPSTPSSSIVSTPRTPPSAPPMAPPPLERVGSTYRQVSKTDEYTAPCSTSAKSQPPAPLRGSSSGQVMTSVASQLSPTFTRLSESSHLPRSQSPTITLLQAAREGQIPKGAIYIDHKVSTKDEASTPPPMPRVNDALFKVKSTEIRDDYRKVHLEPIQHEGIGPTTPQGLPISLRTGIREENKGEWYKKMYKSLHRLGDSSEGRIPYSSSGYMSEPEPDRDDEEFDHHSKTLPIHWPPKAKPVSYRPWTPPSAKYCSDVYRNQPRKIEDYEPGYSSLAEREAKLDDDSIGHVSSASSTIQATLTMQHGARSTDSMSGSYSYKDGYESDSTLVYKKHDSGESVSPTQQRAWYREIQKGGDIPLTGFRRPAPDKLKDMSSYTVPMRLKRSLSSDHTPGVVDLTVLPPVPAPPPKVPLVDVGSESPHRYQESDVNIHYKTPVRSLEKEFIEEEELRRRQEGMMMQYYEDERRKKYIAGITDMDNRRHTDNYLPSQKSPISLDRYDNPFDPVVSSPTPRGRTPEPKSVARAKYNFQAQNPKELNLTKGDIIYIIRRIDKNWFEGEHHGMIGMFPVSYVEIIPHNNVHVMSPKKMSDGIAKAKYNFHAQSPLELPAVKGEMVVLTRRVDRNWYMARIGAREGIVPVSYLDVVREPSELDSSPVSPKPVANPVSHSLIMNGSALSPTGYSQPSYPKKNTPSCYQQITPSYTSTSTKRYLPSRPNDTNYHEKKQPVNQSLHIDTHSEPVPYRALYEYHPQNEDELELHEGDTVFVMEKCDDGWFVGSSLRTGYFGTFPGNYVERL